MEQLNHYNTAFQEKKFPITVICDEIYFQQNIGSIFRICDAFGVEKIIFTGKNFVFSERKINKTSRNTHKQVDYEIFLDKQEVIHQLTETDCNIIAIEITSSSKPLQDIKADLNNKPLVIIIGSEIYGVSNDFLNITSNSYHITMFGKNSSMNVVQSLSIALYEITKKNI